MAIWKTRPPEMFWVGPSLSLPQKVKIFMANSNRSYGVDLPQAWKFFIIFTYRVLSFATNILYLPRICCMIGLNHTIFHNTQTVYRVCIQFV